MLRSGTCSSTRSCGSLPRSACSGHRARAVEGDVQAEAAAPPDFAVPERVQRMNAELADCLKGRAILAPLTRANHLPFRRLCVDFGAHATMSEMIFARHLIRGDPVEKARLLKASCEGCYGVQIATNTIDEGVRAAEIAAAAGATWLDINCGCPIHEATRRGLGAALLRKPAKLARMVNGIVLRSPLPVTVKIRSGESAKKVNAAHVTELLEAAGAAAVTIHGRTMEQRYKKAADWDLIDAVAASRQVPVLGNGDILTHYELRQRRQGACHAFLVGRGALIKPWIFQELQEDRELLLSALDRVGVMRRLVAYMREHFGDDEKGRRKAFYFWPWHFDFFHRYRHLPEEVYGAYAQQAPLICRRTDLADPLLWESEDALPPLEQLLRCEAPEAHAAVAAALWDAGSDSEAVRALEDLASRELAGWQAAVKAGGGGREDITAQG